MPGVIFEGSPLDAYMQEIGSPEDTIKLPPRAPSPPPTLGPAYGAASGAKSRLEQGAVIPQTVYDRLHGMFGPLPAELSFLVSSSVAEEPSAPTMNPFAERLKRLVCSSLLLAGPGAALLQYSHPPRSLQRSSGITASVSAAVVTVVAALRARPFWSIVSVLAFVWSYYTSRVKRGETKLTELQAKLLDKVEVLLHFAQSFDTSVQRAMNLIREVECVSRGWGLSSPLPPVSRLEQSNLGLAGALDTTSTRDVDDPHALRAVDVRRVLQQSLRDARQMCKATCGVLERFIRGGEDGEELQGLYAAYGVAPEPVQLAALALSGKGPRPLSLSTASPGASRQRDSLKSSMNRTQGRRLSMIPSMPGSPTKSQQDEPLASPFQPRMSSPPPVLASEAEKRASRASSLPRSNRSSLFASRASQNLDVERFGAGHGPHGEDLSLATIDGAMELLHTDRQRTLCHLLAIDYEAETEEQEERLQTAADAVSVLAERFRCGNEAIRAAAEREFGPDCLDAEAIPEEEAEARLPGEMPATPRVNRSGQPIEAFDRAHSPRQMQSSETLRSFAPPLPTGHRERQHVDAFAERSSAMSLALRSVTAKLHVAGTDLRSTLSSPDETEDPNRIIKMHDSIRSDLEVLMREWDQSRVTLRQALLPPVPPSRPRAPPDEPPEFLNAPEIEAEEEMIDDMDRRSSTISSNEVFTPVDRLSPAIELIDGDGLDQKVEEVFEAVSAPPERIKLSRSERIRLAQEKRDRQTMEPRPDVHMIGELKDVLEELGRRR